jgi:hypothetical protein
MRANDLTGKNDVLLRGCSTRYCLNMWKEKQVTPAHFQNHGQKHLDGINQRNLDDSHVDTWLERQTGSQLLKFMRCAFSESTEQGDQRPFDEAM